MKISRDTERKLTRDDETRDNQILPEYNMRYVDPLTLDPRVVRDGYSYYWAPVHIKGEAVYDVETLAGRGWTLVPISRIGGMSIDPLKRNPLAGEYITHRDVILMECPTHLVNMRTQAFNDHNQNILKSLRGVQNETPAFNTTRSINSF